MRVWDVPPEILCNTHLNGEHHEIHCIYSIVSRGTKGYSYHSETKRWVGKLDALKIRHDKVAKEMVDSRNMNHKTPLEFVGDSKVQDVLINTIEEQMELITNKDCDCPRKSR